MIRTFVMKELKKWAQILKNVFKVNNKEKSTNACIQVFHQMQRQMTCRGLPFFWLWAMFLQFSSFVLLLYLNMIWPCIWTYTHFWSSCSKILNICALKTLQKYLPSTQKTVFLVKRPKWSPFYKSFSRLYQKWSPSCTFYFKYAD